MEETKWQKTVAWVRHTGLYIQALVKWLLVALVVGVACGALGSAFHIGVERATELRGEHPWLLWCLPLAGLLIVGFYRLTRTEGQGTNDIIDAVHLGKGLTLKLLPAIFFGTVLTHLCGGSAGREGAALQMGGTIGHKVGAWFRLDDRDMRTATMAGMAAFFSALFGTPLTATVFAMVVISIGVMYHAAFIPCFAASLTAYGVSRLMGVAPTAFAAARSGTATRIISHPASSSRRICATVAETSSVRVLHMDWMVTGAPPPTGTPPTRICLLIGTLPPQKTGMAGG